MALTVFSGPIKSGTLKDGSSTNNLGSIELVQTGTISQTAAGTTDLVFRLPANSQIVSIIVDVITQWDSATSATLTVGSASTGTQYRSGVDVKAQTTRAAFTPTNAQCAAMANITTNTNVYATVASVGATTTGTARVTILYVQN